MAELRFYFSSEFTYNIFLISSVECVYEISKHSPKDTAIYRKASIVIIIYLMYIRAYNNIRENYHKNLI